MPMQDKNNSSNTIIKKIGKMTYEIQINFNQNSNENFNDKLLRLVKNDIEKGA
jgi:hypothetical protein